MDHDKAVRKLQGWIADLRATPEAVRAMPQSLAPIVKARLDASISSGQSVGGKAWAPRKEDGARALQGAQKDLRVLAIVGSNPAIKIVLSNGLVYSQYGTRHQQRREILDWDEGIPPTLGNAIRRGIVDFGLPFMQRAGGHGKGAAGVPWKASAAV